MHSYWDSCSFSPAAASKRRFNSIDLCPVGDKPIPPEEGEADEHAAGELTDETVPCLHKAAECAFENLLTYFMEGVHVFKRI